MAFTRQQLYQIPLRSNRLVVDDWMLMMSYFVSEEYLDVIMPQFLCKYLWPYEADVKHYCLKIYELCLKAQDGYFEQNEWRDEFYFVNLEMLMKAAYIRARKERNRDRWVVIPDVNTPDFVVMMTIASRNVFAKKNPWKLNSNFYDDPDTDESGELTSMEKTYRESEISSNEDLLSYQRSPDDQKLSAIVKLLTAIKSFSTRKSGERSTTCPSACTIS